MEVVSTLDVYKTLDLNELKCELKSVYVADFANIKHPRSHRNKMGTWT